MPNLKRDPFMAIADPTRREIISLLSQNELRLNDIAAQFKVSRPAISKHIKILEECGVVQITPVGRERYCHLDASSLKQIYEWLKYYEQFWDDKLDNLGKYLKKKSSRSKK
ncbi:MAG: metalloregulator ArsR/SmtB family transcription factor [Bacteroidota bacterium]